VPLAAAVVVCRNKSIALAEHLVFQCRKALKTSSLAIPRPTAFHLQPRLCSQEKQVQAMGHKEREVHVTSAKAAWKEQEEEWTSSHARA